MSHEENLIEIEKGLEEAVNLEGGPAEYSINTYPADYPLTVLHKMWHDGDIIIPPFQRDFVWKQPQASKLVESFLTDLPIPAIFLYTEKETNRFLVIDGQQRLKTIVYFIDGFFGEEIKGKRSIFRLKGLNEKSRWANITYNELSESDKRKFNNSILRAFVVTQSNPKDDTSIYHIFERLNTGGTNLSSQEIRNCIYHGKLNSLLSNLNKYENWRNILGKQDLDQRQRDIELILRFFAFMTYEKYETPFKDYLSSFMSNNRNITDEEITNLSDKFKVVCDLLVTHLGAKPFHIIRGINTAVFDSVSVAISRNLENDFSDFLSKYKSLLALQEFKDVISGPISNPNVVAKRFSIAEKALFN